MLALTPLRFDELVEEAVPHYVGRQMPDVVSCRLPQHKAMPFCCVNLVNNARLKVASQCESNRRARRSFWKGKTVSKYPTG